MEAFIKKWDCCLPSTNNQCEHFRVDWTEVYLDYVINERYDIIIPGTIGVGEETGSMEQTVSSMNMAEPCLE